MSKVIAFANQKGGVGKTTSAINIGEGLRFLGYKVLFVDCDSQCNLTLSLKGKTKVLSSREIVLNNIDANEAIQKVDEGELIPGSANISTLDMELASRSDKAGRLKRALDKIKNNYDYVIVDCPPTLGVMTVNALGAADEVIIPVNLDVFSIQGVIQLVKTISVVKEYVNNNLHILGILITADNIESELKDSIIEEIEKMARIINTKVFNTTIYVSPIIKEAILYRKSIFKYKPNSNQAHDYLDLIKEII